MGPPKLSDTLDISLEEAQKLFDSYGKAFPKLNKWLDAQSKFAVENMHSRTFAPCKRIRWYPEMRKAIEVYKGIKSGELEESKENWKRYLMIKGSTERNGGNQPIQGSGADIVKEAMVEARNLIKRYEEKFGDGCVYLICTVHDELDFEVREDLTNDFEKEISKIMIDVGNKYVTKVNMAIDVTTTDFWTK